MLWDTMSLWVVPRKTAGTSVKVTSPKHSDEAHLRRDSEAHLRSEAHLHHPVSERRSVSGHHHLGWPPHVWSNNHDFATKDNGSLNAFSAWGTHSDGKVHSESDEECEDHDNVEPHAAKRPFFSRPHQALAPPFFEVGRRPRGTMKYDSNTSAVTAK